MGETPNLSPQNVSEILTELKQPSLPPAENPVKTLSSQDIANILREMQEEKQPQLVEQINEKKDRLLSKNEVSEILQEMGLTPLDLSKQNVADILTEMGLITGKPTPLLPDLSEEPESSPTPTLQDLAEKFEEKKQRIIDAIRLATKDVLSMKNVEETITKLGEALENPKDVYAKYRVVLLFDEVKTKVGEKEYGDLMDNLKTLGLTQQTVEGFRNDAMRLDIDMKNREAYVKATKSQSTQELYARVFARLEAAKKEDGTIDLEKASSLDIYLAAMIAKQLAEETDDPAERAKIVIPESPRVDEAVARVREATKDLPEEISVKLMELSQREPQTPEEEDLKKKYAALFEQAAIGEMVDKPELVSPPEKENQFEKMSDEEKLNWAIDRLNNLSKKIVGEGTYSLFAKQYARLSFLTNLLTGIISESKFPNSDDEQEKFVKAVFARFAPIPNIINPNHELKNDKFVSINQNNQQDIDRDYQREISSGKTPNEYVNVLMENIDLLGKRLEINKIVDALNLSYSTVTDEKSFEKQKLDIAILQVLFDHELSEKKVSRENKEKYQQIIRLPQFFEVYPIYEDDLREEIKRQKQEIIFEETEKIANIKTEEKNVNEPQTVEELKNEKPEKRIKISRKIGMALLLGVALVGVGLGKGLIDNIQKYGGVQASNQPGIEEKSEEQMPTQGQTVGGVSFGKPAGPPAPEKEKAEAPILPIMRAGETPEAKPSAEGAQIPDTRTAQSEKNEAVKTYKMGPGGYPTAGDVTLKILSIIYPDKKYVAGRQWTSKYSKAYWEALAKVNGIKTDEQIPWKNFNNLPAGFELKVTPEVEHAAAAMVE